MNLVIDIGNTSCKIARYEGMRQLSLQKVEDPANLSEIIREQFDTIVLASVRDTDLRLKSVLRGQCREFIDFNIDFVRARVNASDPLYRYLDNMPDGMGADRMAAIMEASYLFPDEDILLFDFGTATTVEFINRGHYVGGAISLGLNTRYRALSHFTRKIPLIEPQTLLSKGDINTISTIGYDLDTALAAGNVLGIKFEIEGYMRVHPHRKVILTGGDAKIFAAGLPDSVMVREDLVLDALARIAMGQNE